jgi:CBS domain-containing protein
MNAKDVMSPSVVSIPADASILQAIQLMLKKRISGLPVVDGEGRLVGIVTEGDFLRRAETETQHRRPRWLDFLLGPGRLADEYTHSHGRKVADVMTPKPVTVAEDTPLAEVVRLMEKRQIKRVPVVRDQKPIGIVSRANLLHALASVIREIKPASQSDATIRERLHAELGKQMWAPTALINLIVRDGIVELWGTISDERERQALKVAAENTPGVTGIRDHLALVDPISGMVTYQPGDEPTETVRQDLL